MKNYFIVVIIGLLIVGVLAFSLKLFDTSSFSANSSSVEDSFYLVIDDETITSSSSDLLVNYSPKTILVNSSGGYSIKVVPKEDVSLLFMVDDVPVELSSLTNVTSGFTFNTTSDSFTISCSNSFLSFFSRLYPDRNVSVDLDSFDFSQDCFTLIVSCGSKIISVDFHLTSEYIDSLTFAEEIYVL